MVHLRVFETLVAGTALHRDGQGAPQVHVLCLCLRGCVDVHDAAGQLAPTKFGEARPGLAMFALQDHRIVDDDARKHDASHGFHMPQAARTV
jgi:hypothetical protein